MSINPTSDFGNYIPETYVIPDDLNELRIKTTQIFNDLAIAINSKDTGFYIEEEFACGQVYFSSTTAFANRTPDLREVFRKVIDFGILPNAGTKNVAHGITTNQNFVFTRIYATATDPAVATTNSAIPIPYINVAAPADSVQFNVDATNINITTTTANYINYTRCYVVLEYVKEV